MIIYISIVTITIEKKILKLFIHMYKIENESNFSSFFYYITNPGDNKPTPGNSPLCPDALHLLQLVLLVLEYTPGNGGLALP